MTDRYAVIGHPIAHSKSPLIHRLFAAQTGQNISYEAIEAPLDGFAATIERLRAESYKGCNVTVPFKMEAAQLVTIAELRATTAGAANTLYWNELGELVGDNTDGVGLVRDIRVNLGFNLEGKRVLIMGAGGATRGVLYPLMDQTAFLPSQQTPALIVLANRTLSKATQIINEPDFQKIASKRNPSKPSTTTLATSSYETLAGQQFDIVINATSSSLSNELPPLPPGIFAPGALAYDMMYGRETPFMRFAREQGAAQVADGLGMLVEQAAEAFFIWRGVRPDTAPVLASLRG